MKTDNEVLADFMGLKVNDIIAPFDEYHIVHDGIDRFVKADQLPYPKSWSALMPVWYKFKELKYPVPSSLSSGQFYGLFLDHQGQIIRSILHSGCAEACKLLSDGIRWYNTIKK